ncbi:putative manganese-dependent inorganic diphosphatase [Opitutales bacterium ASA1]|uniref:putative manganese-dependent inorganic diphosphatase n=1 Tax=Congregicoccus parvus TaxID=3081749 RepID=UPI002B309FC3|nr:putative manganese-dependent inorganic diphosphatase [Opitutales bacterium ASA1]
MAQAQNPTYIIGHRNPDADAICSAIAYAAFKQAAGQSGFVAARCGNSNARIDAILSRFEQPLPLFLADVTPRVRDIMITDVVRAERGATCAECLELIDRHDIRSLPLVDEDERVLGFISVFQLGGYFVPKLKDPREMRHVFSSINSVVRALKAKVLYLRDGDTFEDMYVKIGAMDIRSFGRMADVEVIPSSQTIIVVGDRWDIQQRSIQVGVRLLVITGNLEVDPEVVEQAREKGVSVVVSPYDSATTAWIVRTASLVDHMIDTNIVTFAAEERLVDVRRKAGAHNTLAYAVLDDAGRLQGIFSKSDLLKSVRTSLVLVDHNEMSQAVPGAAEVNIVEVIDHHRLGALNTQQPILFINEPVGSTCTIVADQFRRSGLVPSPSIAGVMMGGIISDTLNLVSPTSTEKDALLLRWLENISGVQADDLAETIFSSGSVILSSTPDEVIRADFKIYEEEGVRFSVSQVEELGFSNFRKHDEKITDALARLRAAEGLYFAGLLVTDINTQNSLFVIKGEREFLERITYKSVEHADIFDMPGIVSRKKQLLPFLTSILRSLNVDGSLAASPAAR